ncbi:MAG: molybdenum cofactor biosynthesis protein MoaE [Alphaproteobacteria bacterium]|nr:molybdenum cofactor biosynthesis protein MoaE [Alphaproteobacteria bacterium]
MAQIEVEVLDQPFDPAAALSRLSGNDADCGAVASFLGQVRGEGELIALELEHYPGVTDKALKRIAHTATERWNLSRVIILHRVGRMETGEPIVFVGAAAPHRRAALDATGFMIDVLKTEAPFWKKTHTVSGSHWVEVRESDNAASARWLSDKGVTE